MQSHVTALLVTERLADLRREAELDRRSHASRRHRSTGLSRRLGRRHAG